MNDRHNLIAFLSVLVTIAVLFSISAACLYNGRSVEAIGIGGVMTGLIGVLGSFRPVRAGPSGTPGDPVNVDPKPGTAIQTETQE